MIKLVIVIAFDKKTNNEKPTMATQLKQGKKPLASCAVIDKATIINTAIEQLYIDGYYSDVTFVVDGTEFKAHKAILAGQSSVMRKQFKEMEGKNKKSIQVTGNANSFRHFLGWFYTCRLDVRQMSMETIWDVIFFACDYEVAELMSSLIGCLLQNINIDTAFDFFAASFKITDVQVQIACRQFLCENAEDVVKDFRLMDLPKQAVLDLVSNEKFNAPEIDILLAVSCWNKRNPNESVKEILNHIRFGEVKLDGTSMLQIAPVYEMLVANSIDFAQIGNSSDTLKERSQGLILIFIWFLNFRFFF